MHLMLGGGRLFEAGHLFEVGANSRLGTYSNQYGMLVLEEAKNNGLHHSRRW